MQGFLRLLKKKHYYSLMFFALMEFDLYKVLTNVK